MSFYVYLILGGEFIGYFFLYFRLRLVSLVLFYNDVELQLCSRGLKVIS